MVLKKQLSILFILFTSIQAYAQKYGFVYDDKSNDVENAGFTGNVKSASQFKVNMVDGKAEKGELLCTWKFNKNKQLLEYCTFGSNSRTSWINKDSLTYDNKGNCLETYKLVYYTYPNGTSEKTISEQTSKKYIGKNLLLEAKTYKYGKVVNEVNNTYNKSNQLLRSVEINKDYSDYKLETNIKYNSKGQIVDSVYINTDIKNNKVKYFHSVHKVYDGKGQLTELTNIENYKDTVVTKYAYDDKGKLIEEYEKSQRKVYEYYPDGTLKKMFYYKGPKSLHKIYTYDKKGREVCVVKSDAEIPIKISTTFDGTHKITTDYSQSVFKDSTVYDKDGNIVESIRYKPDRIWEKRVMTYENGEMTSSTDYYGKDNKYRKKRATPTHVNGRHKVYTEYSEFGDEEIMVVSEDEDEDVIYVTPTEDNQYSIMSEYEYVDEPWADSKGIFEYDKWGNKTAFILCDDSGDCHKVMAASYEGHKRPTKAEVYVNGKIAEYSLYKTDSHCNITEKLTYEKDALVKSLKYEFEYYKK